jgi:hypothetical protein
MPVMVAAQSGAKKPKEQSVLLFAVSKTGLGTSIDPIVIINQGRFTQPPSGQSDISTLRKFANSYYTSGRKYRFLFGGGEAGSVTVKKWLGRDRDCARTLASAEIKGATTLKERVMGVATNSDALGRKRISRRQPTPAERKTVTELAETVYKQKGVSAALISNIKALNMTAVDLNADGKEEIIGTFLIKRLTGNKAAYMLLLFAEPKGKSFTVSFSQYGQVSEKDLPGGASIDQIGRDVLASILVDHIDIDRDRISEVIIADTSFEGITYRIYKRQKGEWRNVYEFYNYRCAF